MTTSTRKLLWLPVVALFAWACSGPQPTVQSNGPNDTPQSNYEQGLASLEKGDADAALVSFQRSVGLDPKFPVGHCGVALAQAAKGNFPAADAAVADAQRWAPDAPYTFETKGRVQAAQGKHKEAISTYDDGLARGATSDLRYWRGASQEKLAAYDKAASDYAEAVKMNPEHKRANEAWRNLQTAQRVAAGAPPEYGKIAHADSVTRADVAAIFCHELNVDVRLRAGATEEVKFDAPKGPMDRANAPAAVVADLTGHWAKGYAERCIGCGAMECYPDHTFKPEAKVNRAEFSMVLAKVLAKGLGDAGLETRFVGQTSPFPDVKGSHFSFNAVMVATTRGLLKAKPDGTFGLSDPVTGSEALEAVRALKIALK